MHTHTQDPTLCQVPGGRCLETGLRYRSGRIVERVRAVRRSLTSSAPPKVVRDLDERLHGVYL
ncbi:hypothetical protein GCM10010211_83500 [Streptomyces albospinus]|uniref:Uncharacterized protein n=1 Tax=Streptomyces albospinus TaxID=285515 RepID=A0ABQ2VPP2_9ACTN|nr:hypothetical protein GCM10010211_83500 [Streptomyces albospinus]